MKNTQSKIKAIKIGKQPETTYYFGRKNYTKNFWPEKVKMTNKVLREKSHSAFCRSNKTSLNKKTTTNVIKIRWKLTARGVEKILKILTQKWLEQRIIG